VKLAATVVVAMLSASWLGCEPNADHQQSVRDGSALRNSAVSMPTAGPDCASVSAHVRSLLVIEFASIPGSMISVDRALAIADGSCRVDQWPLELRRCLRAVPLLGPGSGTEGLRGCVSLVPSALRTTLEPKLRAL
jgi:hypothetical protein